MTKPLRVSIYRGVLMVLLGLLAYLPTQGMTQTTATGKPILIGVHGDQSKQASYQLLILKDTMDLFVGEFNAAGGAKGRPMKLLFEDDENSPVMAATKFETLRNPKDR